MTQGQCRTLLRTLAFYPLSARASLVVTTSKAMQTTKYCSSKFLLNRLNCVMAVKQLCVDN